MVESMPGEPVGSEQTREPRIVEQPINRAMRRSITVHIRWCSKITMFEHLAQRSKKRKENT